MVKVEETTQGVLDKISEGFAQKGACLLYTSLMREHPATVLC